MHIEPSKVQGWLVVMGTALAAILWFSTIHSLPPRVERLEITTQELQKRMDRNDIKTDIILDDVKTIKNFLLQQHGGK